MDFDDPADHRVKLKESKKKDKYLDLGIELKKKKNTKKNKKKKKQNSSWRMRRTKFSGILRHQIPVRRLEIVTKKEKNKIREKKKKKKENLPNFEFCHPSEP